MFILKVLCHVSCWGAFNSTRCHCGRSARESFNQTADSGSDFWMISSPLYGDSIVFVAAAAAANGDKSPLVIGWSSGGHLLAIKTADTQLQEQSTLSTCRLSVSISPLLFLSLPLPALFVYGPTISWLLNLLLFNSVGWLRKISYVNQQLLWVCFS